jgi:hypothetical protein
MIWEYIESIIGVTCYCWQCPNAASWKAKDHDGTIATYACDGCKAAIEAIEL